MTRYLFRTTANSGFPFISDYPNPPTSTARLCLDEGTADLSTTLAGAEVSTLLLDNLGSLLDGLLTLGKDELDVAGVGHVGVDLDSQLVSWVDLTSSGET